MRMSVGSYKWRMTFSTSVEEGEKPLHAALGQRATTHPAWVNTLHSVRAIWQRAATLVCGFLCCIVGMYMFIEASKPRNPLDNAKVLKQVKVPGSASLSFYYHMYGRSTGMLRVLAQDKEVFKAEGDKGNGWMKADNIRLPSGTVKVWTISRVAHIMTWRFARRERKRVITLATDVAWWQCRPYHVLLWFDFKLPVSIRGRSGQRVARRHRVWWRLCRRRRRRRRRRMWR